MAEFTPGDAVGPQWVAVGAQWSPVLGQCPSATDHTLLPEVIPSSLMLFQQASVLLFLI